MPNYQETPDDYRIKYSGCFAFVNGLEEKYAPVVRINDTFKTDDNGRVYQAYVTTFAKTPKNQTILDEKFVPIQDIELRSLRLGAINLKGSVVFLQSVKPDGAMKYRRLPNDGNFKLLDPFKKEREYLSLRHPKGIMDYFILNAWGNREFFSATDALDDVMNHRRLASAFTNEYFFGISYAGDGIFLYKNGKRIARVNTNGEVLLKPAIYCLTEQLSEFGLNVKKVNR